MFHDGVTKFLFEYPTPSEVIDLWFLHFPNFMAPQLNSSYHNRLKSWDFFLHHLNVDRFVIKGWFIFTMECFVVNPSSLIWTLILLLLFCYRFIVVVSRLSWSSNSFGYCSEIRHGYPWSFYMTKPMLNQRWWRRVPKEFEHSDTLVLQHLKKCRGRCHGSLEWLVVFKANKYQSFCHVESFLAS